MDKLLDHYVAALGDLRRAIRRYGEAHPEMAGALELVNDTSEDPEIERLLQSIALLNATSALRLEESKGAQARAQLEMIHPHYLRPIPSMAIAHIDASAARVNEITTVTQLPRWTILKSGNCRFRTCQDVQIAPIAMTAAAFVPVIDVPATMQLPHESTSAISITISTTANNACFDDPPLERLRVHISGPAILSACLIDALFIRQLGTCLEAGGRWTLLPALPFDAVTPELLPPSPGDQSDRLLTEYFTFPEAFNFIDIDLQALARHCPEKCNRLTLHIALPNLHGTHHATALRQLSHQNLRLACTPIINLFDQKAIPIRLDGRNDLYPVTPDRDGSEIYTLDSVAQRSRTGDREFAPFHSARHATESGFWLLDTDEGHAIKLVGKDMHSLPLSNGTLSIQLTCTNGQAAEALPHGEPLGDLVTEASTNGLPIRLLQKPTAPKMLATAPCDHRRLLTAMNAVQLAELLRLHAQQDIAGITFAGEEPATAWVQTSIGLNYMHGTMIRLCIDEAALKDRSVYVLAQVLLQYFAAQVPASRFCQLHLVRADETELLRTRAVQGQARLL